MSTKLKSTHSFHPTEQVHRRFRLYNDIKNILTKARQNAYKAVDLTMVNAYWHVGQLIVEDEQMGKRKAEYGSHLLKLLSDRLMNDFGRGFSEQSLRNMRQFYTLFPIRSALRSELSWTHYKLLIRVDNQESRDFYIKEVISSNWSSRALERQINSHYYERLLSSKKRGLVKAEAKKNTQHLRVKAGDIIKDPYILEFLGLKTGISYHEKDLEQALISQLQKFLLELGRGFSYIARQQRISTETKEFYIDLVFYNYILKCFVLIDLKVGELTHQDIGQMDMYARLYEDKFRRRGDNPTIGIILCAEKDETVIKYSVLSDNKSLFASKYKLYLPTEKELIEEIEREKKFLRGRPSPC